MEVSEKHVAFIYRVEGNSELGTALAVNRHEARCEETLTIQAQQVYQMSCHVSAVPSIYTPEQNLLKRARNSLQLCSRSFL
jgi:hypothetical protein